MSKYVNIVSDKKKQTTFIPEIPINSIEISKFNPRRSVDEKHVENLANLIDTHGFDHTFALKCYKEGEKYSVFAG